MRTRIGQRDVAIVDRERLARALHRATCDCEEGARSLTECVLGQDVGWLEESDRLLGLLREDEDAREDAPAGVQLPRTAVAAAAPARV